MTVRYVTHLSEVQKSKLPARVCPECGEWNYDDDFEIIVCSSCGYLYNTDDGEEILV